MPGHHGKSGKSMGKSQGSHGDKGNNNRESYRTSSSYQKSVTPKQIKTSARKVKVSTGKTHLNT